MVRVGGEEAGDKGWNTALINWTFTIADNIFVSGRIYTNVSGVSWGCGVGWSQSQAGGAIDNFEKGTYDVLGFGMSQIQRSESVFNDWNMC